MASRPKYIPKTNPLPNPPKPTYTATKPTRITQRSSPLDAKPSTTSSARGQTSAGGVLAEIDTALKKVNDHNETYIPKFNDDIKTKIAAILPQLGVKNIRPQTLDAIAKDATAITVETLGTIQIKEQIPQVLTQSIVQSVYTNIETAMQMRQDELRAHDIISSQVGDLITTHDTNLEKSAVLGNVANIASLTENEFTDAIIQTQTEAIAQEQAPLASEAEKTVVKTKVSEYTKSYFKNLDETLTPIITQDNVPTLEQYSQLKEQAHNAADAATTQPTGTKINTKDVTRRAGTLLSFKPLTIETANELGLGTAEPSATTFVDTKSATGFSVGLALGLPQIQEQALETLIDHNQFKLKPSLDALTKRQNELTTKIKNNKPLTYREKIEYKANQDRILLLRKSRDSVFKKQGAAKTIRSYFKHEMGKGANLAWESVRGTGGIVFLPVHTVRGLGYEFRNAKNNLKMIASPKKFAKYHMMMLRENGRILFSPYTAMKNEIFLARHTFGNLAVVKGLKNIRNINNLKQTIMGGGWVLGIAKGMGMTPPSIATNFAMRALKISGATFGGLLFMFMSLGGAALAGFIAGAIVGGVAGMITGAIIGAQVGATVGTFILPVGGTVIGGAVGAIIGGIIGGLTGGAIGGLAGGLLMYGLSSGSISAGTAGVGVGAGGITGAIIGGTLGSAFGPLGTMIGAFVGAYVGAVIGGLIGLLIGKTIEALGGAMSGAALGAMVGFYFGGPLGALIGAGIGWLAGGGWSTIKDFLTGGAGVAGGAAGGLVSAFAAGFSAAWNGLAAAGGGFLNALGSVAGGLTNAIGSLASSGTTALTASVSSLGTAAGIGATGALAAAVLIPAALSSIETDTQILTSGNNQYFQVTKIANRTNIPNPPPTQEITFAITLTAKAQKLTNIVITDNMVVQGSGSPITITQDKDGKDISPITTCTTEMNPNQTCTHTITITAIDAYKDSTISNTIQVKATPEGQNEVVDSSTAVVIVGSPPAQCPRGWPTTGVVTQGPEGAASHGPAKLDLEALDIATAVGTPVYATIEAVVTGTPHNGDKDQIIDAQPISCTGLKTIRYQHLSKLFVRAGDTIRYGQKIGETGDAGTGPHMHYQFNYQHDRTFKMEIPNIPANVPRDCSSDSGCTPPGTISSAP